MLTLITWLKWCLPVFSTVNVPFPPSLLDLDHSHFVILWDYGFKTKKSVLELTIPPLHSPITPQSHTHVPLYAWSLSSEFT